MLRKKRELTKLIAWKMDDFKKTIRKETASTEDSKSASTKSSTKGKGGHPSEADFKLKVLRLYQREVNASEEALLVVLRGLQRTLASDYQSLEKIRLSCELRLKEMQGVALQIEEHHNTLHQLEKEAKAIQKGHNSSKHHIMNDMLSEISEAADKLENNLKEDLFSDMVGGHEAGVETVLKVGVAPSDEEQIKKGREVYDYGGQVLIIDSHSNQYILSRPRDITALVEDPHLVMDVVLLLVFASLLGAICCLLNIPQLFGYGIAGMLLGPAGYNLIKVSYGTAESAVIATGLYVVSERAKNNDKQLILPVLAKLTLWNVAEQVNSAAVDLLCYASCFCVLLLLSRWFRSRQSVTLEQSSLCSWPGLNSLQKN